VRVVDYIGNPGGGVRFAVEMLRALQELSEARFEVVSHGPALARFRALLQGEPRIRLTDIAPKEAWRSRTVLPGIPGSGPLNLLLGSGRFHLEVPASALEECDLAWFPWIHRHRLPASYGARVVGSLHDVIAFDFPGVVPRRSADNERETVRRWLRSDASLVVSSEVTAGRLAALFGTARERVSLVPLSGQHGRPAPTAAPQSWTFLRKAYLLAPINVTLHKNHEVLLGAVGAWKARHPLVLSGSGSDLWKSRIPRSRALAKLAEATGLCNGETVFGLGYVEDSDYYRLLDQAWALVMPTLAEGGGSFPVWEALLGGIPVICSDIPVMREMVERVGGEVIWFDARDPADLKARLDDLERDYPSIKARALAQVAGLRVRGWREVAADYARVMALPLRNGQVSFGREQ
jgi:glycosyltransferase involved in cell wall biosynthesis